MSSIAKTSISLSKKDLAKSRISPVGYRNVVFYHKATAAQSTINLMALTLPSAEMPTVVQATTEELGSARLIVNKKNLKLTSSMKGDLIQGLDYIVADSTTILLIGPYETIGAEVDEIFVGTIVQAPVSDLVVASSKNVVRSYTLPVGQNLLNLAHEYRVNEYPSENIGIIKIFINGVLAFRNTGNSSITLDRDYYEIDSGTSSGSTVYINVAPVGIANEIIVDYGVQAITDFNAIGAIESLSGSVKKIADDLAVIAGTTPGDYLNANPSDVERRGFGDQVLDHEVRIDAAEATITVLDSKYDTTQNLSVYTKTKHQIKYLSASLSTQTVDIASLHFNNIEIGKTYRVTFQSSVYGIGSNESYGILDIFNGVTHLTRSRATSNFADRYSRFVTGGAVVFTASSTYIQCDFAENATWVMEAAGAQGTWVQLEELPNHQITTQWT